MPFGSSSWIEMVLVVLCCACGVDVFYLHTNALGSIPTDVAVSPNGCQSLLVTWTHRTPTSPLTLNHYRVRYQAQGGSQQTATTTSQGSYTLTGLAPATTYTVRVDAQTQLGYGDFCCEPTATTDNGKALTDACMASQGDCDTFLFVLFCFCKVCSMFSVLVYDSVSYVLFLQHLPKFLIPGIALVHANCSEHDSHFPLLQWVPHGWSHWSL